MNEATTTKTLLERDTLAYLVGKCTLIHKSYEPAIYGVLRRSKTPKNVVNGGSFLLRYLQEILLNPWQAQGLNIGKYTGSSQAR